MFSRCKSSFHLAMIALVSALLLLACSSPHHATRDSANAPTSQPQAREGMWEIRDTRLFVREVGPTSAPTLLVVHGGPGGNHLSLRPLEALAPQYRVVLYDQRGTGESDRLKVSLSDPPSLGQLTLEQNIEDIEALRQKLGRDKISLIGHSWGAALAVFYAAAYPRHVEKLIVYSGGPETHELADRKKQAHDARLSSDEKTLAKERMLAFKAALDKHATQEEFDELFVQMASVMLPSLYCKRPAGEIQKEMGRAGFFANQVAGRYVASFEYKAIANKLRELKAPVLLTWGRCEPSPQERLTNLLDYLPNARFVIFEHSGHNAMEEEAGLFFNTLRAFLAGKPLPTNSYHSRIEVPSSPISP